MSLSAILFIVSVPVQFRVGLRFGFGPYFVFGLSFVVRCVCSMLYKAVLGSVLVMCLCLVHVCEDFAWFFIVDMFSLFWIDDVLCLN